MARHGGRARCTIEGCELRVEWQRRVLRAAEAGAAAEEWLAVRVNDTDAVGGGWTAVQACLVFWRENKLALPLLGPFRFAPLTSALMLTRLTLHLQLASAGTLVGVC